MRRRVTPVRVAIGLAVVATVAWFGVVLTSPTLTPAAPPAVPNPNGYDDVLKSAREIKDLGFDPTRAESRDAVVLRTSLAPLGHALASARAGLGRPFQVPYQYDMNDVMNRSFPETAVIRSYLARALGSDGLLAELEGRPDDAVNAYLDLVRLGLAVSRGVTISTHQLGLAIQMNGLSKLRDLRASLNAAQCRRVIESLETLGSSAEPAAAAARHELDFMDANVRKMPIPARVSFSLFGILRKQKALAEASYTDGVKRAEVRFGILLTDLAVRLEVLERGKPPATLDDLVPGILKSVPVDPYGSGKPLVYRLTPDGYQLYSLGPDGDDDHLDPPLGRRHTGTSNGDFTIDSF